MVPWQTLNQFLILIFIVNNIIQGHGYSRSLESDKEDRIQNDVPDLSIDGNFYNTESRKGGRRVFSGGCIRRPDVPTNGKMKCSSNSGCIISCASDYQFPNGARHLSLICINKEWHVDGTEWNYIPHCEPICMPKCQNSGICIAPHHCDCPEHFAGPHCQFEDRPCLNYPPSVLNSYKKCNSKSCTVSCINHFTFPDGSSVANLICQNGNWKPTKNDWVSIPDCEPVCDPPCQNGGNCLPSNLCQCPQDYRGPQCQYLANACDAEKLRFNGGYYCTSDGDIYSCTLNCPTGVEFEFSPVAAYTCTYDKGIFKPQPIPQCKVSNNVKIISLGTSYNTYVRESNHSWLMQDMFGSKTKLFSENYNRYHSVHGNNNSSTITAVRENRPKPETCFTWGGTHYKTFDDRIYSFDSDCSHILLRETQDGIFTIVTSNSPGCRNGSSCFKIIKLFIHDKEYILTRDETDTPTFSNGKRFLPIPIYLPGLRVDKSAHFILISLDLLGVKLKWDGSLLLQIEAFESMWNKTAGLCGTMNNDLNDEFFTKSGNHAKSIEAWANSWRVNDLGEICDDYPSTHHACESRDEYFRDAFEFCIKLLSDRKFQSCADTINLSELTEACLWDYCACKDDDKKKCACNTMDVYIRQCIHKGLTQITMWRSNDTCPISCSNGRVYMSCGPKIEPSCSSGIETRIETSECEEGCFCPDGTIENLGKCISPKECPCRLRGKLFQPGTNVPKGCNTCTCTSGKWICTQVLCGARCAIVGDPHYTTFDGKHYDFMGKCTYYLMKDENYTIESENVPCSGAISESMGFASTDSPSCTKSVIITFRGIHIKLKQNRQITMNGEEITKFPVLYDGIKVRIASSIFVVIHLPNALDIWWDGVSRVYINAPAEFHSQTKGLCGTFTENQKDDFVTPEGDIEPTAIAFANKWKTTEYCVEKFEKEPEHPCELNPQRRTIAEDYCSKIHTDLFSDCHWYVDPAQFYKDCMYDMCACDTDVKSCFCPILAAYAKDCAAMGIKLAWRSEINECKIHCSNGQIYQICGNSCTRSCGDISFYRDCKEECVEGCNCPEGQTLDINGECIPIAQCPCIHASREYKPNHREVRPGNKGQEYCTCIGGIWECRLATPEEILKYPPVKDLLSVCLASKNLEVTDCEPVEQRTCSNMHISTEQNPAVCISGCICKSGYILDVPNGACIKEKDCPCHHGGKSYKEGSIIQNECNTCVCEGTKWKCTNKICAGVCSVWGDSHYKTFDGKMFDFQGICDYVLVKSVNTKEQSFDVSIQNVPCGTNGVACSKSIKLVVGNGEEQEELILTKGKKLIKKAFKRMTIRTAGLFVFVDVPDLGLVLQWDKGTTVYIRLNTEWKGRTMGLCGDYNDNAEDDFKTPSGGIPEVSVNLFGDSWKKDTFCPEPKDLQDTCEQHPERKLWSLRQCNVLKSSLFLSCHSEVEVEPYINRCIFDTCSCDAGGDCECLCTALAAYAHECNSKGVPIKWRTQELCPMQCDENCSSYSSCISTCPRETCDNLMTIKHDLHLCAEDTCVDGCLLKPCPDGQVYWNASYTECTPKSACKSFCAEIKGVTFYEGDKISSDDCHSCFCSRGKITCKGEACTSTISSSVTVPLTEPQKCVDGWSVWINKDPATKGTKFWDVEPLPNSIDLANVDGFAVCDKEHIIDIKCRSVKEHLSPKESGLDVECSLERGLYCQSRPNFPCMDFEISVLCHCSEPVTHSLEDVTEVSTIIEKQKEECNVTQPNSPHPTDCHLFYQCVPTLTGYKLVGKSCGLNMLYNSNTQVCDWPAEVLRTRSECSVNYTTPSKTEWTSDMKNHFENTLSTSVNKIVSTTNLCKDGEVWSDCAIQCSRVCQYYHHILTTQGHCIDSMDCIAGCVSINRLGCPSHKFWRDGITCIDASDCSCKSHNGISVAPGAIRKESDCEICQCINNYYTCDTTICSNTRSYEEISTSSANIIMQSPPTISSGDVSHKTESITSSTSSKEHMILLHSTVTPLEDCDNENYKPLIRTLQKDISLHVSSSINPALQLKNLLIHNEEPLPISESWEPEVSDANQWLDLNFGKLEPIYGIILQGGIIKDKFVTSYKVLFSEDNQTYSYIFDHEKQPRIFRGPVDKDQSVEQRFYQPIEAKIIRIHPLTWHNGIAIKMEVLGCQDNIASTITTQQPTIKTSISDKILKPICEDSMGLDNGLMVIQQVSVSSSPQLIQYLPLSSENIWRSTLDNPHQYVQFDFLENRNLTGIITKGGLGAWTTAYKIFYSNDGQRWNPIINEDGREKEFLGNFDSEGRRTNFFERPIHARFLRIQPTKWHTHIALKVEVLGCYLTYPTMSFEVTTVLPQIEEICNICNGIEFVSDVKGCRCNDPYWWDGEFCVLKQECPCVVGHVFYAVGSAYETEDCQECVCVLGGTATCMPKKCEPCYESGLQSIVNELCTCLCKSCPVGTRHCPTSDVCINETMWCNGVQDCPDDEKDCVKVVPVTLPTTDLETRSTIDYYVTTESSVRSPCEEPWCPPGYKITFKQLSQLRDKINHNIHRKNYSKAHIKSSRGFVKTKEYRKPSHEHPVKDKGQVMTENIYCPEFTCVPTKSPPILRGEKKPEKCPEASCPPHYKVVYEKINMYKLRKCPKYVCKPLILQEAVCNITGRTFSTFDNMEYKYDICNHILARDMYGNEWYITLEKQCDTHSNFCTRIMIVTINEHVIVLYPDLHVSIDEHIFTANQIARLGNKFDSFKLSRTGDKIIFVSHYYGFWTIWDSNSNAKIGVTAKLTGRVDGLCGYFDENITNDRQTADGKQAKSTIQFGNSWAMEDAAECDTHVCPRNIQEKALMICNSIKSPTLFVCSDIINYDKFVSHCIESVCSCLRSNSSYENCRCRLLTNFVTECKAADTDVDLSDWRTIHDCPISCSSSLVHTDCFKNKCETTCENLHEVDPCPVMQGICFPGCFCPDGMVRQNDKCILPVQCRDCICDGFGNSKFIGFNRKDFKFDGNCTYILSQNIMENAKNQTKAHAYQILISNKNCATGTCTEAVTLLYEKHVVQIRQTKQPREWQVFINDSKVHDFPYNTTWIMLDQTSNGDIALLIPSIQLELAIFRQNFAFTLKLPSHIFGEATEGLCGSCNGDSENSFKTRNEKITDDADEFGKSWLFNDLLKDLKLTDQTCFSGHQPQCAPPPVKEDVCKTLLNLTEFKQCHSIVDPEPYLNTCYDALCTGGSYCDSLEMYARKCLDAGLCPAWRTDGICPYECPQDLVYQPCTSDCEVTCDSLNKLNNIKCTSNSVEGCFCPQNYIFHNNSCIPKENCFICDKDGHVNGDIWYPDKCTECTCNNGIINCQKTECPVFDIICEENMSPVLINGSEETCCSKYLCVSKPTESTACIELQEPECGFGQIMRTITDTDGCHKFICQCLPINECPVFDEIINEIELEPGFIQIMNTSGCCPRPSKVCDPTTCPSALDCPDYYNATVNTNTDNCCPIYECVPPKDICFYEINMKEQHKKHTIVKQIGEEWKDGICKTCICENSNNGPKSNCLITECTDVNVHPDRNDYILEEKVLNDKCCPVFERIACKDEDKIYNIDESWQPNIKNACVMMQCNKYANTIQKQIKLRECDVTCDYGYEYQPSNDTSVNCCGTCIQVACTVEGVLKNIGEQWYSDDHCVTYICESTKGNVYVQANTEICPEIDPQLQLDFEIQKQVIPGKCCPEVIKTACRSEGNLYQPGDKWKIGRCITETCLDGSNITKHKEIEVCSKQCPDGWIYQESEDEKCCGRCKEIFCVFENTLYPPGAIWSSTDNCTTFTCIEQNNQLSLAISPVTCPDITNCPSESIYDDLCCKRCNLTTHSQIEKSVCTTDTVNASNTLGMLVVNHPLHGKCKNLDAIEGIKECHGTCKSSTYLDNGTWNQVNDCQCCQVAKYIAIIVNLTCEDGRRLKKQLATPSSCSCQTCASADFNINSGKKMKTKG